MILEALQLDGAFRLRPERRGDERGFLERLFCREDFARLGLKDCSQQVSHVANHGARILRGMHFQHEPFAETKLIWVFSGTICDVLVDIRPGSPTYGRSEVLILSGEDGSLIYAPAGLAHGYLTLSDESHMVYHIDRPYSSAHAAGIAFDDPDLAIKWPAEPAVISDRDRRWPRLADLRS